MKHNLLKSVIISVILLMGVSNAWALNANNARIYFDNTNSKWTYVQLVGGHNTWSSGTALSKISNTNNLWTTAWTWGGYSYFMFIDAEGSWPGESKEAWNRKGDLNYSATITHNVGSNTYFYYPSSNDKNTGYTTSQDITGYAALNYNQTVQQHLSTNGSAYAASTASIATVKVSSYKLSNATTTAADSKTIASSQSSATCSAARTATVTYSVTGVNTGYKFVGWYDGNTQKSTSTTYTYQATEAKTITARFEKTYAVTISAGANGIVSPSGSQQVGSTSVTIKATANAGYKFKNWTTTGGVVIANANNATTTITATAIGTVKANFEEDLTSTWHIVGDPTSIFKGTSTWAAHNDNMLKKTTGASTASKGSLTIDVKTLPANNDSYQFKVLNTNGTKWYGWSNETNNHFWVNQTITTGVYNQDNNNLYFIPNALGEYKFAVDWSSSNPSLTVTFPTAYAVTFGKGTGGSSVTAKYNSTSFNSGTKVQQGKTVTFTQSASTGYTFKEWNTKSDGTGTKLSAEATYTHTVTTSNNVYAVYTQNPDRTIYLEPTGFWNSNNPQYVAHVWGSGDEDITMTGVGEAPYRYYTCEVPAKYTNILFYRKSTDGSTIWNQTADLTLPNKSTALYEIKSTGNKTPGQDGYSAATGVWKEANLVYTITLGYCDFGTYGIKYNGQSYFSKPKENVTIDVPAGAQIEILEGQPFSNAYTGDVVKKKPTNEKLTTGQALTINGDVTLDDNFITTTEHVVYLGIPDAINTPEIWAKADKANFIYTWDTYASYGLVASTGSFRIDALGITYYEFTIPEERHSFRFQRKSSLNDKGTPHCESVSLEHEIPLTDVNCFTLKNEKDGSNRYKGTWGVLPTQPGDYRLLYVEQVVEKDADGYTIITRKKAHPSNIIKEGTASQTVSLHTYKDRTYTANAGGGLTYTSSNNPEIILQKYLGNDQWEDVECQMVYGPIETIPVMAQLPGRKNASSNSAIDDLKLHNGIENIKNDTHPDKGNGVWNFVVTQDNAGNASVQWDQTHRYTGEYYIRTDNAEGRWDQYTLNDNYMTYSQYAKDHSGFSHYFCKWVEVSKDDNTKFVIANDYGIAISDTLAQDAYTINEHGDIKHDANIRWSWNMVNNEIARAYIQGTWDVKTSTRNRNLVVNYKSSSTAADQEALLDDSGDWIYQKDFTVKVGSHLNSLTAQYPVSKGTTQTFASNLDMLTGNPANTNEYKVRILYDFKINKTLVALVPDNGKQADIAIDVIIERVDQKPATQVQAQVNATRTEGSTVYAVMSFTKEHINGGASKYAKQFYWISFPFNVRVSDVFGFGEYGKHWIIQWYDGAERAKNGCWIDSPTYWKFQTDTTDYVLEAGKGYVLTLDLAEMDVFANTNQVSLYFPSRNTVKTVDGEIIHELNTTTLDPYTCTIQRNDRWSKDSHWHMLGVPSYANKNKSFTQDDVAYFYTYDSSDDTYDVTSSGSFNFNSMFSYMVQFAGTINWSQFAFDANGSQGLAAKRNTDNANDKHVLRLELQKNNASVDQIFVQLQAEEATEMFDMNLDLTKMVNSGNNIYSLIPGTESNIEVAANVMPIAETIIPLGVKITAAGEYTFAMPEGTDGIVVELIDYENNTRTNMLLDNYTVNLGKGTFENRFALHVQPNKTTTSLEDINTNSNGVKKYLIDGILYMQKDGVLYDAQGKLVR